MKNIQTILNAILSKDIFEYILVDRALTVVQTSEGIAKYLEQAPQKGDEIALHLPELVGSEEEIKKIFVKKYSLFTLEAVNKKEYYVNISIEYYDDTMALILLHNITAATTTQQKLLQYSNESMLLYNTLQKVVDNQSTLLFVTNNEHIEFANKRLMEYFDIPDKETLRQKELRLYREFGDSFEDYDALYAEVARQKEIQVKIGEDTFILEASLVESTYKLFTLTKITALFHEMQLDPLTGIYRKGYLNEYLEKAIRERRKFSLIVVDIDNFKQINDTYGHLVGDRILREFVSLIKRNIRKDDLFARWGGEEFILLFEGSDLEAALHKTENIRRLIEEHRFDKVEHMTASFGITHILDRDTVDSIVNRADKALYQAKSNGKNQVVFKAY